MRKRVRKKLELHEFCRNRNYILNFYYYKIVWKQIKKLTQQAITTGDIDLLINSVWMKDIIVKEYDLFCPYLGSIEESLLIRDWFINDYGYSLISSEGIKAIKKYSKKIVAVGSGTGFLEKIILENGCDIIATDNKSWKKWNIFYQDILDLDATEAIEKYSDRDLFMSWPSYSEPWAHQAIQKLKIGRYFFYVGESPGGCTADDNFYDYLDENFEIVELVSIPKWVGIRDMLGIFKKIK